VDKILLLFRRLDGLTSEEFHQHYLEVHAPMATKWVRVIHRYVVNVTDQPAPASATARLGPAPAGDWQFDAVTEAWVDSVAAYQDNRACFAEKAQAVAMRDDHFSFIGTMHGYQVDERVVADRGPASAAGRTPGVKLVLVFDAGAAGADGPSPDAAVPDGVRVVDSRVLEVITPDSPSVGRILEVTGPTVDDVVGAAGAVPAGTHWYLASEHVQRA
jgi:hypothetical protein